MTAATASKSVSKVASKKPAVAPVAAVAAPKVSAGDAAIAACKKAGASNGTVLKAVWSTRGNIFADVAGFDGGIAIIKSDLTAMLKALPADEASVFVLTPRADGSGADLSTAKVK